MELQNMLVIACKAANREVSVSLASNSGVNITTSMLLMRTQQGDSSRPLLQDSPAPTRNFPKKRKRIRSRVCRCPHSTGPEGDYRPSTSSRTERTTSVARDPALITPLW